MTRVAHRLAIWKPAGSRKLATGLTAMLLLAGCSRKDTAVRATSQIEPQQPAATAAKAIDREVTLGSAAQRQAGIATYAVRVRSIPQVLHANGRIALNENQTWRVGAVTEGRIVYVYANVGDRVQQGQILARMHSHMIHEGRAEYRKALAEFARLKNVEAYSLRARDRAQRLLKLKAASQEQADLAETEYRNAQTATSNAQIEVERTRRHLVEFLQIPPDLPEHDPAREHEDEQDLIPIRAAAAGTLMVRNVTAGAVVQPSADLFVISDLSELWTIAALNEEYLPKVRAGMPVRVYVQAWPDRPFPGRIGKIGEELDPTTRTVRVRIDMPNMAGKLKPEMYATTEIELGGSEPAIFVPQEALQEVSGQTVVFVRRAADRFEVRPVVQGRVMEGLREIVSGLRGGEAVVVQGSFPLKSQLLKASLGQE